MYKVTVVAEIGCNHNGDPELAKRMVLAAKECGVDAVKFQTFRADKLISSIAPKAEYQKKTTGTEDSQLEMTRKLELSQKDFLMLRDYAVSIGLEVFSTPFDMESVDFLHECGQKVWKIPSGEITNLPYLQKIGGLNIADNQVILSTGMADLTEIKRCVDILVESGMKEDQIMILHCNTEYPTPDEDINLLAIQDLKAHFPKHKIGFSDHSVGYVAGVAAVALGVVMIEKHFTLDKNMPGPDHKASANVEELRRLCNGVRRMEKMLGDGEKIVTASEEKNKIVARKSIVAQTDIKKGDKFTVDNITCKRPGNGISPMCWYDVLGKTAAKDFAKDALIEVEGIEFQEQ